MEFKNTPRGFKYTEFIDSHDQKCSIQKSSVATYEAIWFGIDDADPKIMATDAKRLGLPTFGETTGWVPYEVPKEVLFHTRMHLSQDQVKELLPTLIKFAETGEL